MMFNALTAVKFAVSGVVGIGTGKIVSGIVKDHVKPETLIDKVSIVAATWTLSGIVTTASKKYTSDMIDEVVKGVSDTMASLKLAQKLNRINNDQSSFEDEGLDENDFVKNEKNGKWESKPEAINATVTETPVTS